VAIIPEKVLNAYMNTNANSQDKTYRFFAAAPKGIETLLAEELKDLGLRSVKESRSGAYFEDNIKAAYRVCLWSRTAVRVLFPVSSFAANSPEELYAGIAKVDWSEHLTVANTLAVDANVSNSNITHSQYAGLKIKDAIVDYFRDRDNDRPSVDTKRPDVRINAYINNNNAEVYIDLSGDSLHKRGYRDEGTTAPLKENLAAAILLRAKWPEIAAEGGDFVDFMCGSGTLPIEAAMMACDIAPGLLRTYYGFTGWKQHQPEAWQALIEEAQKRREKGLERTPVIRGFDNHRKTIGKAQHHVRKANLDAYISFEYQDVFDFRLEFSRKGLVVLNPPYGKRLGQDDDMADLYETIGDVLKNNFINWKASVFTDSLDLGKQIGIRANKIHSLFNGAIECKLLHFDVLESEFFSDSRLPGFVGHDQLTENADMFRNRLNKNRKHLAKWSRKENINCYRLYDADLPDYSMAVDVYSGDTLWLHVQEYEAPKSIDQNKARWRLREAITILRDTFGLDESQLFLKTRSRQRGESQYEKLDMSKNFHRVEESGYKLLVNFEDYLDTGLFLDHRITRSLITAAAKGKSLLNLFAYTGAITVAAAVGGAIRTSSVDMSKTYLRWAQKNMTLNGFLGKEHEFIHADCLEWLARTDHDTKYDLIFLDPPTFSNSKRMTRVLDLQKDHVDMIKQAMDLLEDGGELYFSNNARRFKLDETALREYNITDISAKTIPQDFKRRQNIHHCWLLKKVAEV
jgi:23S rRNA (guanine2445-N2)-methyltransferase / 23S rRNA (guanine2069-N7)-methyltransferase